MKNLYVLKTYDLRGCVIDGMECVIDGMRRVIDGMECVIDDPSTTESSQQIRVVYYTPLVVWMPARLFRCYCSVYYTLGVIYCSGPARLIRERVCVKNCGLSRG